MYAGMASLWVRPGKTDEATEVYRRHILPALKEQSGFECGLFLTDGGANEGVIVGVWDTWAAAEAFEDGGAYLEQSVKLKDLLAAPTVRRVYEVGARV